jgi:hypothetical protein
MRTSSTACEDAVVDATLEPEAPSFSQLSCTKRPPADFLRSASSRSWVRMLSHFRRSFSDFSRCSADCARHVRTCVLYSSFQASSSPEAKLSNDDSALTPDAVWAIGGSGATISCAGVGDQSGGAKASSRAAYEV